MDGFDFGSFFSFCLVLVSHLGGVVRSWYAYIYSDFQDKVLGSGSAHMDDVYDLFSGLLFIFKVAQFY